MTAVGIVAVTVIGSARAGAEQQPPPIHGVTGTIATEESIKDTTEAGGTIFSKAKRLLHLNRKSQSGDAAGDEALRGLKRGTAVTLGEASEGKKQMEGAVTEVNRDDGKISVKLADGTQQTLRLADRAERDTAGAVVVYYTNAAGQRVALNFKRLR
jgi:hypothetical protein